MNIIVAKDYDQLSALAADFVICQVKKKPAAVLGLPTGSTPLGLYRKLQMANLPCRQAGGKWHRANGKAGVSFMKVITFNLDEYYGLDPKNPRSYRYYMDRNLFNKIDIDKKNTHVPSGDLKRSEVNKVCRQYEKEIEKHGGIDLQILGLGRNGHIGFNEPGSAFSSKTRLIKLTQKTINDNARFFADKKLVPRQAITMGLGTIMKAKKILLIISGENRSPVVKRLVKGKVSLSFPASILHRHQDVTVIVDRAAARLLKKIINIDNTLKML